MPIIPTFTPRSARALIIGIVGFLIGVGVVATIIVLNQGKTNEASSGNRDLPIGTVARQEKKIKEGGPFLFTDPDDPTVGIFVNQKDDGSWIAFESQSNKCQLEWEKQTRTFIAADPATCEMDVLFNEEGCVPTSVTAASLNTASTNDSSTNTRDLLHYATSIKNGRLIVELGSPDSNYCTRNR